jgi:hypothetical protein
VATENNTVYAIDASSGAILVQRTLDTDLGPSVSEPLGCNNNGPHVGINGTPVIDQGSQTLFLITYVSISSSTSNYYLHALNLSDLTDKVNRVQVAASHTLNDGSTYPFNGFYQRQRPGLLFQNGTVYAGFGSFCDYSADKSRGWLLGWQWNATSPSLTALTANQLNDTQTTSNVRTDGFPSSAAPFFLTSIWMSGYGIAGDASGNLYFSTGNSDCNFYVSPEPCPSPASTWQNPPYHVQESVVKLSGSLGATTNGIFTPANTLSLDQSDEDLGSGGVLVLPQPIGTCNSAPCNLAAAAGKDGRLFLLNQGSLSNGPITPPPSPGSCWCGPSFFVGEDGISRIVTSQGTTLQTWSVVPSSSGSPTLVQVQGRSATISSSQDGGFFTWISSQSSDGTQYGKPVAGSEIVWAVGRPTGSHAHGLNPTAVTLYAFKWSPTTAFKQLFSGPAGSWPNTGGNANIVPVVVNGKVYVASAYLDSSNNTRGQLNIFGSGGTGTPLAAAVADPISPHVISGVLIAVSGSTLTLQTRGGGSATIDASQAIQKHSVGAPRKLGVPFTVLGSTIEANGALLATAIVRAKGVSGDLWPPDK